MIDMETLTTVATFLMIGVFGAVAITIMIIDRKEK